MKFNLERSAYSNNRSNLLASNGVPKLSDAKANLGDSLAKVVFEQCEEALREDFGLKVPLNGPGDMLWVSPSDLLIGKIALKPPFTPKCLQALTHKGILEIGEDLKQRFKQEMEVDKQKTLEKYKAELLATIEDRMKSEIKDVEIRERLNCHMELEKQQHTFEVVLRDELNRLEKKIREQYEKLMTKNKEQLELEWEEKLQEEVKRTVENMTKKYLAQIDEQEEKLTKAFELELKKKEILREFDVKLYKSKMNEALRALKHSLECRNLVNMMYVLCSERRKCCEKKQYIENHYQQIVTELEDQIIKRDNKIAQLTNEKEYQIQEVKLRDNCLQEVTRHFQKFINFALRAAPTQAEFLLSIEKMMVFDLTNEITKSQFPKAELEQFVIPWKYDYKIKTPSVRSDLEISDNHNCLNELNPPTPKNGSELGEDADLPAMYFNNKMYVREDFRDLLSTGIEIKPSDTIWNKDVEILINNWRGEPAAPSEPVKIISLDKDSMEELRQEVQDKKQEDEFSMNYTVERRKSKQSTVQFIDTDVVEPRRRSTDSRKIPSRKTSLKPTIFPVELVENIDSVPVSATNILAAKDSLEIIVEQKLKSNMSIEFLNQKDRLDNQEENNKISTVEDTTEKDLELVVETRDSVILRKSSLAKHQSSAEFNVSPKDSIEVAKFTLDKGYEVKSKPSKLTSAKNSVELLRESLIKLRAPSLICQRKQLEQNTLINPMSVFGETCCEHCKRKESFNLGSEAEESKILKRESTSDEKSVKMSRVEVINLEDHITAPSVVSFQTEPKIFDTPTDSNIEIPPKKTTKSKKYKKTSKSAVYKLKVVGDQCAKEGEQSSNEFTETRIHSLINLMKGHPQLLQLFTAGSR